MTSGTGLKLIISEGGERVLKPSCTIKMDRDIYTFGEFVAVGYNAHTGITSMLNHADPITLGRSLMLINDAFQRSLEELTPVQKESVLDIIRG